MEIDEIEMDEQADERREPWYEGDTLMVPVYEEVLVSYTQLMLRKIVRVHNRGETEQVNLKGTVRREVVDIEQVDADGAPAEE
jgi:stress response protein YsnF